MTLPLSVRIRVTAEMAPSEIRGLAQVMYEEWLPEAERLEGAVEAGEALFTALDHALRDPVIAAHGGWQDDARRALVTWRAVKT